MTSIFLKQDILLRLIQVKEYSWAVQDFEANSHRSILTQLVTLQIFILLNFQKDLEPSNYGMSVPT